jgi:hypothetical protein
MFIFITMTTEIDKLDRFSSQLAFNTSAEIYAGEQIFLINARNAGQQPMSTFTMQNTLYWALNKQKNLIYLKYQICGTSGRLLCLKLPVLSV